MRKADDEKASSGRGLPTESGGGECVKNVKKLKYCERKTYVPQAPSVIFFENATSLPEGGSFGRFILHRSRFLLRPRGLGGKYTIFDALQKKGSVA